MAASENVRFSGSPRPGPLPTMSDGQFRQWAQLLEERTGIVVPPERKSFLATSIALRMREIGYDDFQEYHEFLLAGHHGAVEWAVLLDRLTVHETRFFRHPPSFRLIRQFRQWAQLLEERTGIVVPPERKSFLATSIALRMREIGYDDFQEYHEFLLAGHHGAVEWAVLLDRLTVHETRFFRHPPSFRLIRERFLPIEGAVGPGP